MPKELYLIRHAQAEEPMAGDKDFDRELTSKGSMDVSKMGKWLSDQSITCDMILSSPAVRAKNSAIYLAEQLKFDTNVIIYDEELYEASVRTLLQVITKASDKWNTLLVIGHNPSISYLAEYISGSAIGKVTTSGIVLLHFDVNNWNEVSEANGKFLWYQYPASLKNLY